MLMKLIIMLLIATSLVGCKNKAAAPAEPAQAEAFSFESIDVGASYVDISLPDMQGKKISLSDVVTKQGNKYVLLDFWASWCGPCIREMPYLCAAYKEFHDKGFEIYATSLDSDDKAWRQAIENNKMVWVNIFANASSPRGYEWVNSIPTNLLIDCSTGKVVAKNLRGEAVAAKLKELIK